MNICAPRRNFQMWNVFLLHLDRVITKILSLPKVITSEKSSPFFLNQKMDLYASEQALNRN